MGRERGDGGEFEMAMTSRATYPTQRWISRYETQVESGSHMPVNGVGATGPDGLLQGGSSIEGRGGQCEMQPGPSGLLALARAGIPRWSVRFSQVLFQRI